MLEDSFWCIIFRWNKNYKENFIVFVWFFRRNCFGAARTAFGRGKCLHIFDTCTLERIVYVRWTSVLSGCSWRWMLCHTIDIDDFFGWSAPQECVERFQTYRGMICCTNSRWALWVSETVWCVFAFDRTRRRISRSSCSRSEVLEDRKK